MFRAMMIKEFREIRVILIGAMLLCGIPLLDRMTNLLEWFGYVNIPFIQDDFVGLFVLFAVLVAMILGLWQTFGESVRGTYPFLLHRSARVGWLIGMKLFVGMAAYLTVTGAPLLIYALWAATPGTHASPFEWSMTAQVCCIWLAMTIVYFGAFLTGIMPGRWYGARFLPLITAGFTVFVITQFTFVFEGPWWLYAITLAVDVWLVILIRFVAKTRDYS